LALFVSIPFLMGVVSAVTLHRDGYRGRKATLLNSQVVLVVINGALLLFALEGVICLLMALPVTAPFLFLGALLGDWLVKGQAQPGRPVRTMALALPLYMMLPLLASEAPRLEPVVSSIEIDAPPEVVWPNVIAFSPLPAIEHPLFKAGIAAPIGARIEGAGVGAVRHCEFTTGSFVEPITVWDEPHRLAFDVTAQPPTMRELGPWSVVYAPHVENSLRSHRGEFLLTRLPGDRTRLTGTTWYTLELAPEPYWRWWGDEVIGLIHQRVLSHVKSESEQVAASGQLR
jgi:hypothetical protein